MQEHILYIKLVERSPFIGSNREEYTNCINLGNRRECFRVINSICLGIAFGYQSSFVSLNSSIVFNRKNPPTSHWFFARWKCTLFLCFVLLKCFHISLHGFFLLSRFQGFLSCRRCLFRAQSGDKRFSFLGQVSFSEIFHRKF